MATSPFGGASLWYARRDLQVTRLRGERVEFGCAAGLSSHLEVHLMIIKSAATHVLRPWLLATYHSD